MSIPAQIKDNGRRRALKAISKPLRRCITVFPFIKTLFLDGNPVGIKHAMKLAGTDTRRIAVAAVGSE